MINNKQVNLWRGSDPPPTFYHIWIYDNKEMRLYNGTEWVTFVDELFILEKLNLLEKKIIENKESIDKITNFTINNKQISANPILNAGDIPSNYQTLLQGPYVEDKLICTESLFTTLIIE